MSRPVSIQRSLLTSVLAVIVLQGAAIVAVSMVGSRRAVRTLSRKVVTRAVERTRAELRLFFEPLSDLMALTSDWGVAGQLDPDHPDALEGLLRPIVDDYPQVTSLMVADDRGHETMLLRMDGRRVSRRTRADEWGVRSQWFEWSDESPEPEMSWRELRYDPRVRPWYEGAAGDLRPGEGKGGIHWTNPYRFFTTKDPGITLAQAFEPPGGGHRSVVAFDVRLSDISAFTRALVTSPRGEVFVLTEDHRVIGLPAGERFADAAVADAALLRPLEELGLETASDLAAAMDAAAAGTGGTGTGGTGEPLRFATGGRMCWGAFSRYALTPERTLLIAVVIPESDMLADLASQREWMVVITLAVLLLAMLRAGVLARRYSRPVEALVRQSDRISRGDLDSPEPVESNVSEVHQLAAAHERMRVGLRELLKLERDIQVARQIQESTFPDELPVLAGFDVATWSEPADETGGDTYDVIGVRDGGGSGPVVVAGGESADRALLLLADATGHGIGPALSVTQIRAMIRMAVREGVDLARIARHLNDQLCDDMPAGRFITAWLGELDAKARTLRSFSAGQGPLLLYRAAEGRVEEVKVDAAPFGIEKDMTISLQPPIELGPGDVFVVLSDGVYEAMDGEGMQFGRERVEAVVVREDARDPNALLAALRVAVEDFTGGVPADDDRTGIVLRCSGPS